jgi:hypothetical protein
MGRQVLGVIRLPKMLKSKPDEALEEDETFMECRSYQCGKLEVKHVSMRGIGRYNITNSVNFGF